MGCWDYRIFGDDVALDAVAELLARRDYRNMLEAYLDSALAEADDYLEYDTCVYGLVAAALVDAVQNGVDWNLLTDVLTEKDNEYVRLLQELEAVDVWLLSEKADRVLEAVEGDNSELRALWEENRTLYPLWLENLHAIRGRIRSNENLPEEIQRIHREKAMCDADFFRLTDLLDWDQEGEDERVLEPLIAYLAKCPEEVIIAFDDRMAKLLYDLDSAELARRIYGTDGHFSGDEFLYIRCVALVNGADFYYQVRDGRRELGNDLGFEAILYVPAMAWARKYGKELQVYSHMTDVSYETGSNREKW